MVYSSPYLIESYLHVLWFMTCCERPILEIQHYRKYSLSSFYENIVFASSSFYYNHQVSIRRSHLSKYRRMKCIWSIIFVKHTRTKNHCLLIIAHTSSDTENESTRRHTERAPLILYGQDIKSREHQTIGWPNTVTPCRGATTNHEGSVSFEE